jgi:hypothetical protein
MDKNTSGYKNIPFPRAGQAMSARRSLMTQELLCQHWTLETSSKQKGPSRLENIDYIDSHVQRDTRMKLRWENILFLNLVPPKQCDWCACKTYQVEHSVSSA